MKHYPYQHTTCIQMAVAALLLGVDATDNGKSEHRIVRVKPHAPARVVFQW